MYYKPFTESDHEVFKDSFKNSFPKGSNVESFIGGIGYKNNKIYYKIDMEVAVPIEWIAENGVIEVEDVKDYLRDFYGFDVK